MKPYSYRGRYAYFLRGLLLIICTALQSYTYAQDGNTRPVQVPDSLTRALLPSAAGEEPQLIADYATEMPNPQVWSFMKYGNITVNNYTGTAYTSIPLYHYTDNDFDISMSLDYASNGFMPNVPAGEAGLGWFLNVGGYITREIRGFSDEKDNQICSIYGYYQYYKYGSPYDYDHILELGRGPEERTEVSKPANVFAFPKSASTYVETQPDIFTFRFLNHSGTFQMDVGRVLVYNTNHPAGEYQINLDKFPKTIVVKTGSGYKYSFGFPYETQPYQYLVYIGKNGYEAEPPTTWVLKEIEAPNGRKATFSYNSNAYSDRVCFRSVNPQPLILTDKPDTMRYRYIRELVTSINRIKIENFEIRFGYEKRLREEKYPVQEEGIFYPDSLETLPRLREIVVQDNRHSRTLNKCTFGYFYAPSSIGDSPEKGNPLLFLESVDISGEGTYRFEYYDTNLPKLFPLHGSAAVDHWGYYTGRPTYDYEDFNVETTVDANYAETVVTKTREPNFPGARMGMLRRILYPTGGSTIFYYEGHDYAFRLTQDKTTGYRPDLKQVGTFIPAGGVRIKRITNYITWSDSTSREFIYRYRDNQTMSSGNLLHYPRYKLPYVQGGEEKTLKYLTVPIGESMDYTHIEYPEIIEKYSDGSFQVYRYTGYGDMPDRFADLSKTRPKYTSVTPVTYPEQFEVFCARNSSLHTQRGMPLTQEAYDNTGKMVRRTEYEYDHGVQTVWQPSVELAYEQFYRRSTLVDDYPLRKVYQTDYFAEGPLTQIVDYRYNRLKQVSCTTTTASDGTILCDSTQWLCDYPNYETVWVLKKIGKDNFWHTPFYSQRTIIAPGAGPDAAPRIVQAQKRIYDLRYNGSTNNYLVMPKEIYSADIDHPVVTIDTLCYRSEGSFGYNRLWQILWERDKSGLTTFYVYGYGGQHIVAKIANTNEDTLTPIFGKLWDGTVLERNLSPEQKQAVQAIHGAQVTLYEWQPFVGITSMTDPSGRTTYYEYTSTGKLARVLDEHRRVLTEYDYSSDQNEDAL